MIQHAPALLQHLQLLGIFDDLVNKVTGPVNEFNKAINDTGAFLSDLLQFVISNLFPEDLTLWFFGTIGWNVPGTGVVAGTTQWDPNSVYQNIYNSMAAFGIVVAAVAGASRVTKLSMDARAPWTAMIADVLPRFILATAPLIPVSNGVSLGYTAITTLVNLSSWVGTHMSFAILGGQFVLGSGGALKVTGHPHASVVEQFIFVFMNIPKITVASLLSIIPLIILLLYGMGLMIVRTLMVGFGIALAGPMFATVAYEPRNKFFQWWSSMFTGALLIPPILSLGFSVSLALAWHVGLAGFGTLGAIFANIIMFGGCWMTAKMIHGLTWNGFSHQSVMGAATGILGVAGAFSLAARAIDPDRFARGGLGRVTGLMADFRAAVGGFFSNQSAPQNNQGGGGAPAAGGGPVPAGVAPTRAAAADDYYRGAGGGGPAPVGAAGVATTMLAGFADHNGALIGRTIMARRPDLQAGITSGNPATRRQAQVDAADALLQDMRAGTREDRLTYNEIVRNAWAESLSHQGVSERVASVDAVRSRNGFAAYVI